MSLEIPPNMLSQLAVEMLLLVPYLISFCETAHQSSSPLWSIQINYWSLQSFLENTYNS